MATKDKRTRRRILLRALTALLLACVIGLGGTFGMVCWREGNLPAPGNYDAMIVLGSRVNMDGTPSINLGYRLEAALNAWRERPCLIICCGAQGSDEPAPEGDVMRAWLIERGVPEGQALSETASFNTAQSIRNAAEILNQRGMDSALMVTSAYHVPRTMAMAEDAGIEAHALGCEYTTEHWLRHHARETLSWIKYWAQKYLHLPIV